MALFQHVLVVLEQHPAALSAKLEAFAMLMAVTAALVQAELAEGSDAQERNAAYLQYAVASGEYPHLTQLLQAGSPAPVDPAARYAQIVGRVLSGLLGPAGAA